MNEQLMAIWQLPTATPAADGPGRTADDVAEWRGLVERTSSLALANGWSKAEVGRRAGVPDGTFNQWYSGAYKGRLDTTNGKMRQWLDAADEMAAMAEGIPASPSWFETRTSREISEALLYAQVLSRISVITVAAGMGKTISCERYRATRHNVFLATMCPNTRSVHGMLIEVAATLGLDAHNNARLHRAIGERLQRATQPLLIIDEAQNLDDAAIDQLRAFSDRKCGLALVGNEEIYTRFGRKADGPSYAQIRRRFGRRLRRSHPYPEDIAAQLDAWGIADEASRRLLTGIGNKPGALGQIDETLRFAGMAAAADRSPITEKHIRAAWANRGVED